MSLSIHSLSLSTPPTSTCTSTQPTLTGIQFLSGIVVSHAPNMGVGEGGGAPTREGGGGGGGGTGGPAGAGGLGGARRG